MILLFFVDVVVVVFFVVVVVAFDDKGIATFAIGCLDPLQKLCL